MESRIIRGGFTWAQSLKTESAGEEWLWPYAPLGVNRNKSSKSSQSCLKFIPLAASVSSQSLQKMISNTDCHSTTNRYNRWKSLTGCSMYADPSLIVLRFILSDSENLQEIMNTYDKPGCDVIYANSMLAHCSELNKNKRVRR